MSGHFGGIFFFFNIDLQYSVISDNTDKSNACVDFRFPCLEVFVKYQGAHGL